MGAELAMPLWVATAAGAPRRVGVELEMSGVDVDAVAGITARLLDLEISADGRYERRLTGDPAGDWQVEVDFRLLRQWGREDEASPAENALERLALPIVPVEIVSPPLPLERLPDFERIISALHAAGAKGTSDNLTNAFGLQLNPEVPDTEASVIVRFLQAYLCLQDWLVERAHVNLARRATPFVDPLPPDYARLVVARDYRPDQAAMIDDYLEHNPTRNRALDMLPLFAHLDERRVRRVADNPLIKPRPTFHYRLPNSEIHLPGWGLAAAWNDWVEVERLAADARRLADCCAEYARFLARPLERLLGDWSGRVERRWLGR